MQLTTHVEGWQLPQPFRTCRDEWRSVSAVVVELWEGPIVGRGECQGVPYLGETVDSILEQIDAVASDLINGMSRTALLDRLPPGGARNAIDCALWDLEAKRSGRTIWQLTELQPRPVTTVLTIGMEPEPEAMARKAAAARGYPILKIKLDDRQPIECVRAIRKARPDAELMVDANQSWDFDTLCEVAPVFAELGVVAIEQPLPRGNDDELASFQSPVPIAADESCQTTAELDLVVSRYDVINIKLDKAGGLTEALQLAQAARNLGCDLMVGNMLGTSLAMAPSFVVAQLCRFVDLDGPLLLKYDRPNGFVYQGATISGFDSRLWS